MPPRSRSRWLRLALGTIAATLLASNVESNASTPPELGEVEWQRDFEAAADQARASGRPLFAFFQEIPGCATCVSFGQDVLRHPLIVEAIETEFVPVAVYNNRPGADAALLARFDEPAWNNPVVRLLDAEGADLIPRRQGVFGAHEIGERMIAALRAAGRPVPGYLIRAVAELEPGVPAYATFAMHCFWSGEACLGEIPGLISSRAGYLDGREVVEVSFDSSVIDYAALLSEAHRRGCSERVYTHSDAQQRLAEAIFGAAATRTSSIARPAAEADQKRALQQTALRDLTLTPQQALLANAAVAAGRSPAGILSPRQRKSAGLVLPETARGR